MTDLAQATNEQLLAELSKRVEQCPNRGRLLSIIESLAIVAGWSNSQEQRI